MRKLLITILLLLPTISFAQEDATPTDQIEFLKKAMDTMQVQRNTALNEVVSGNARISTLADKLSLERAKNKQLEDQLSKLKEMQNPVKEESKQ